MLFSLFKLAYLYEIKHLFTSILGSQLPPLHWDRHHRLGCAGSVQRHHRPSPQVPGQRGFREGERRPPEHSSESQDDNRILVRSGEAVVKTFSVIIKNIFILKYFPLNGVNGD